jgi:hypothetical protein
VLEPIDDLPEGVVGVEASGKVRLLYAVGHEFPSYTAGAG